MPPRVVDVWADNEEAELARLSGLFKDFPVAVVATYRDLPARRLSHPGHLAVRDGVYHVAGLPPASSSNLEYKFDCLLARTKGVRFLQLVLALLTRDGAVGRLQPPRLLPGPPTRMALVRLSRCYFPQLYDLRFLAERRTPAGDDPQIQPF